MKPAKAGNIDRDYLRRSKAAAPQQKLDWLVAAHDFAQAVRKPPRDRKAGN